MSVLGRPQRNKYLLWQTILILSVVVYSFVFLVKHRGSEKVHLFSIGNEGWIRFAIPVRLEMPLLCRMSPGGAPHQTAESSELFSITH